MWIFDKVRIIRNKKNITFEKVADEWLEMKRKTVKQSTYSNYIYSVKKYLIPELGNITLEKLEKYDFDSFIEELTQTHAPKTVRDILVNLKSILYYAEQSYYCNMKIKKIIGPKLNNEPLVILSKREKGKLERCCLKDNTLKSLGIIICLNTGLRIGEICALKWKDIDLEKKELHVRKTLQRIYIESEKSTKIIIDKPKTRTSIRNIPISNKIYDLLSPLKKEHEDNEFFLTGDIQKYIEPRNYQDVFKKQLKMSKIKTNYKFHILRHTFATNCIEVGMDVKSLSEVLGHASVEITLNKYVHSSYKIKKKYMEKL